MKGYIIFYDDILNWPLIDPIALYPVDIMGGTILEGESNKNKQYVFHSECSVYWEDPTEWPKKFAEQLMNYLNNRYGNPRHFIETIPS